MKLLLAALLLPARFAFLSALLATWPAVAEVVEEVLRVPVEVDSSRHGSVRRDILLTVFRDPGRARAPYLVLNHGRAGAAADRAKLRRAKYTDNSRHFVALGFVVLVPTRLGYGDTGGPDVEDSGPCDDRVFAPAYRAAAEQTLAVLKAAEQLPYVDLSQGLVVGQSFGGLTALTLAGLPVPGLRGAVNFAGGGGGNPTKRPGDPCSKERLRELFGACGAVAQVPTLWLYSENDRYWGAELPQQWRDAFIVAGGQADFIALPPHGEDGHGSFTTQPAAWQSAFADFVRALGFPVPDLVAERARLTPDFLQSDPQASLPKGGAIHCGPVAASNAFVWLAGQGFERLLPAGPDPRKAQIELIRRLTSSDFMATDRHGRTLLPELLHGLHRHVATCGHVQRRLEFQGLAEVPPEWEKARVARQPQLDWLKAALDQPKAVVLAHLGWYRRPTAGDGFVRETGHHVTVVGLRQDQLLVHDPARYAGLQPQTDALELAPFPTGRLIQAGASESSSGWLEVRLPALPDPGIVCLLENVTVLELE
jgi:dienelactone hydrolase